MLKISMEIPAAFIREWSPMMDLDFTLAHHVLENPTVADYYQTRPDGRELILDNSMHELGHPLPPSDLLEAARQCNADYVIAPDRLGEPEWNLDQFFQTVEVIGRRFKIGVVLAGRTVEERRRYLKAVRRHADMLLLPFREDRLSWFLELRPSIESPHNPIPRLHLLGVNTLTELGTFARLSDRREHWSVDTAKPIKLGLTGRLMNDGQPLRGAPISSKDLLNVKDVTPEQLSFIRHNVDIYRNVCVYGE